MSRRPRPTSRSGLAALQKAKAVGAKTQRERDFIDALSRVLYRLRQGPAWRARAGLSQGDGGSGAALSRRRRSADRSTPSRSTSRASPNDKTYANQLKGAAILEQIFKRQPRHPGVAHYLIHLYDYPGPGGERHRCRQALCRDRAGRAARAAHALAHLHARRLLEGIDRLQHRRCARGQGGQGVHTTSCTPWTTWSMPTCSSAQDEKARDVIDEMNAITGVNPNVSPARMRWPRRRRATWSNAATGRARRELPVRPTQFAHVQAMTHFARALGAARSGNPDAAKADIAKLAELRDKLREAKDAYWAEQVDIQRQVATACLLVCRGQAGRRAQGHERRRRCRGQDREAPGDAGAAAARARTLRHHAARARHGAEALAAFEATIKKEPNRFNAIAGAAKAAERLGDQAKAKDYYQKLTRSRAMPIPSGPTSRRRARSWQRTSARIGAPRPPARQRYRRTECS